MVPTAWLACGIRISRARLVAEVAGEGYLEGQRQEV